MDEGLHDAPAVEGSRFAVWRTGVWGLGFGIWGLGLRCWGLGFGFWGRRCAN